MGRSQGPLGPVGWGLWREGIHHPLWKPAVAQVWGQGWEQGLGPLGGPAGSSTKGTLVTSAVGAFFSGEAVVGSGALPDLGEREAGQGSALTAPTQPWHLCQSWWVTPWGHSVSILSVTLSLPVLAQRGEFGALLDVPGPDSQLCPSAVWPRARDLASLGHLRPECS